MSFSNFNVHQNHIPFYIENLNISFMRKTKFRHEELSNRKYFYYCVVISACSQCSECSYCACRTFISGNKHNVISFKTNLHFQYLFDELGKEYKKMVNLTIKNIIYFYKSERKFITFFYFLRGSHYVAQVCLELNA